MLKPLQLALDLFGELATHGRPRPPPSAIVPGVKPALHNEPAGFAYELRRSARRRSLSIEVHPDLSVVVRAPLRFPQAEIERFISARALWVAAQLAHFKRQPRMPLVPTYADGATHYYLGLPHRLRLDPSARHGVEHREDSLIIGGRAARDALAARSALDAWYRKRADELFKTILDECHLHPRFQRYPCPALQIRSMRTRWGSLGTRRGMTLNLVLIQAPRECIEFVVMHELCHLRYHGHGKGFYKLLDAVCPDWRERKRLLEDSLR